MFQLYLQKILSSLSHLIGRRLDMIYVVTKISKLNLGIF